MLKTVFLIFGILLVIQFCAARRFQRDVDMPKTDEATQTLENIGKLLGNIYEGIKTEVEKVATKENMDKVTAAVQSAAESAKKGFETLKEQAAKAAKTDTAS